MDIKNDERSALDSLEQKLYDPKGKIDNVALHHVRDRAEKQLPTSWSEDTPIIHAANDRTGLSFGAKFLIGAIGLLILVLSFAAWRMLSLQNVISEKNIDMVLDITPYVEGGESVPLGVSLSNRNEVDLLEASLTLIYNQGNGAQDEQEKIQVRRELGTVNAGGFKREDFDVVLYGSEAEARDITVKLEYRVPGSSNGKFTKVAVSQVVLKSPPISVHVEGPALLSAGQSGSFDVLVKNNTGTTTTASLVSVTLPTNFTVDETSPKASTRGTIWQVRPLTPGETYTIKITGRVSGSQGETATMRAIVGSVGGSVTEVGVVYSSFAYDIKLRSSPLLLTLTVDTDRATGDTLRYGDRAAVSMSYKNTSNEPLQDVSFVLSIGGDAPLTKQVEPDQGYYNSIAGTVTWDKTGLKELTSLAPGQEGVLFVSIPIVLKGTNAPKLTLNLTGKGTAEIKKDDVVATISKTLVVQGSVSLSARTQYKNSPFPNTGPIPPEPNVETGYALHLTVSAQNALQNAKVSFLLPAYVTWRNAGDTTHVSYDAKTRTVTWNVGTLESGKTISTDVGVSVKPSQSHVGTSPSITGGIVLDADEVESRAHIRTTITGLTTYIGGESWGVDPSRVVDR